MKNCILEKNLKNSPFKHDGEIQKATKKQTKGTIFKNYMQSAVLLAQT